MEGVEVGGLAGPSDQRRRADAEEERAEAGEVAVAADIELPVAPRPSARTKGRAPVLAHDGDGIADLPLVARRLRLADGGAVVEFAPADPGGGGEGEQEQPAPHPAPAGRNLRRQGRNVIHALPLPADGRGGKRAGGAGRGGAGFSGWGAEARKSLLVFLRAGLCIVSFLTPCLFARPTPCAFSPRSPRLPRPLLPRSRRCRRRSSSTAMCGRFSRILAFTVTGRMRRRGRRSCGWTFARRR